MTEPLNISGKRRLLWGAALYIIAPLQYFLAQIIAASVWDPPYSWSKDYISDLGNTACSMHVCSPYHALMNASFIISGILLIIGTILLERFWPKGKLWMTAYILLIIAGMGKIIVGLVPENTILTLHIGGALNIPIGSLAILLLGAALWRTRKALAVTSLLLGIIGLCAISLLGAAESGRVAALLGLGYGGMERLASYPTDLWMIIFAITIRIAMTDRPRPRLLTALPFIGILSIFLYIANLVVYEALAGIFGVALHSQLVALGTALGILSAGLIVSTIVGMRWYNAFTRLYSLASSVWIGLFVYLFLASVAYGLVLMLPFVQAARFGIIGELFMACAVLASIYGIFHAKNMRIKKVSVSLPSLPGEWKGRKAIWVSDLHLGQIHGPAFARKVVDRINAIPHDIVFIGGDLYDGTGAPDLNELIAPLKELSASAPLGVYFITGNHEEFGNSQRFISAVKAAGIEVLQDRMVTIQGLQLIGVDYQTASDKGRFREILSRLEIDADKSSILLKHEPKDLDVAQEAGISFQISGHTHRTQLWPLGYVAKLVYKGFSYGLKPFKSMQVYTSSGVGTWGPPMRVGTDSEIVVFELN